MDEHNNKFRIATTSQTYGAGRTLFSNNVFSLDENLKTVGSLQGIAPDETIYSTRFMGDKLYLVTFRQVDPFFVVDLSEDQPKILGALKIPGFSNYLQPYDDTHIIGFGRDTKATQWGGVQQKGVKISMFDVSDFANPVETDSVVIGDVGTYSEALDNHKALLLDKNKNIMSIPIKGMQPEDPNQIGDYSKTWNGFYVYGFNNTKFVEKGRVFHYTGGSPAYMQSRSLYIGDTLYTVMDGAIKMNDINNIENEINTIRIQQTGNVVPVLPEPAIQ